MSPFSSATFGLGLSLLLVSGSALADRCAFAADRNLDVDAATLSRLALEFGSDDVNIKGVPGLKRIEVRGRACASTQAGLDGIQLEQRRDGNALQLHVSKAELEGRWFGNSYAYVNLEVRVPQSIEIAVKRGSGDVTVENVAAVDSVAGSGDLEARDISGPVLITAGSGDSDLREVGAITVRSLGSGDVHADGINGDVQVDGCGSGELRFGDARGSVNVERIGSGNIEVRRVTGDVRVGSIGSGDIRADDVGGDLIVRSKGSGDVHHSGVKGSVDIPRRR